MPKFLLAYHGSPNFETKEQGQSHMKAWQAWSQSLGDAMIDPGMPVHKAVTVTASEVIDHGGANPLTGITVIEAHSLEAAIDMARGCPHLDPNGTGTIEIAEAMNMEM